MLKDLMDLGTELENQLATALNRHLDHGHHHERIPVHLEESIRYSLMTPGKRIRPRLLIAASEMLGLTHAEVLPAALALEIVHCFTLIHDDLPCMDNDDFRRGLPSNHKKFGETLALLAGDALMALALDVFLDSPIEPARLVAGLKRLISAMGPRGVIGGQAAESLLSRDSRIENLREMHSQKTGALFSAALLIPKEFISISDSSSEGKAIADFASTLGLAFQAADDLEDQLDEEIGPTSILYYLSQSEVAQSTIEQLHSVSQRLREIWGQKSTSLTQIADEVVQKIHRATESTLHPISSNQVTLK